VILYLLRVLLRVCFVVFLATWGVFFVVLFGVFICRSFLIVYSVCDLSISNYNNNCSVGIVVICWFAAVVVQEHCCSLK